MGLTALIARCVEGETVQIETTRVHLAPQKEPRQAFLKPASVPGLFAPAPPFFWVLSVHSAQIRAYGSHLPRRTHGRERPGPANPRHRPVLFLPEVVTAHGPPVQVLPAGLPEGGELVAKCRQVLPLDGGIGVGEILPVLFAHPIVETAVAGPLDFLDVDLPEFRVVDIKGVVPQIYLDLSRQGVGLFAEEFLQSPADGGFHLNRVVPGVFGDADHADEGEKGRKKDGQGAVNKNEFGADGHGKRAHNRFLRIHR